MTDQELFTENDGLNGESRLTQTEALLQKKKAIWLGIAIGIVVTLVAEAGYLTGRKLSQISKERTSSSISANAGYKSSVLSDSLERKLTEIESVFDVYSVYDMDDEQIQDGIVEGFLDGTGDRYCAYYTSEEFDELMGDYSGVFYGIGAVVHIDDETGWATVNYPVQDSPAEKAGIITGDIIYEVNGESTYGLTLDEVVAMIRGEKDTEVVLTIAREGADDYLTMTCVRGPIDEISVEYEMLDDGIGYIQLMNFDEIAVSQFENALNDLNAQGMNALILDLRANSGGLLTTAVGIGNQLLPEGLILYTEDAKGNREDHKSDGKNEIQVPMVVLVNGYSASAAEVLTGAIHDHGKATIMGTTTYGKGVVQNFTRLSDGSVLKLTVERYYTPNGVCVDGVGIEPDVVVEFDADAYYNAEEPFDNQKDAAVNYLKDALAK